MDNVKMNKTTIITALTFLLLINLALAQSGCFIYSDSPFYCSDLSTEEAETECLFYEDCILEQFFFLKESCSDKQLFTECKSVLCKGSCTDELLGKCKAGPVPPGEDELWCSKGGCCQFENYCAYKTSKGLCEVEAKNKDLPEFSFNSDISEVECLTLCSQPVEKETLILEEISNETIIKEPIETTPTLIAASGIEVKDFTEIEIPQNRTLGWLVILAFLIILAVIIFYFYQHPKLRKKLWKNFFPKKKKKIVSKEIKKETKWYSPFFSNHVLEKKINFLKRKRKQKIKKRKRDDFLAAVGLTPKKVTKDEFLKLKGIASSYQRKKKYHPELFKEKEYFHNLEQVVEKVKEREKKFKENLTHPEKFKEKKDVDELIARLRKIAK